MQIGHYQLGEELGAGGMGTVYRGLHTQTEQTVAIKQLKNTIATDDTIERFRREGEALRDLNHPNIVKMLDMFEHEGQHYLVMEYVSGGDLSDLIRQGDIPLERIVNLAIDLADALTRAHRLNIIHRDLKPANIMIGEDGVLRLTDFGVAHVGSKERVTDTDAIVGTIDYLPPEAFSGESFDARGDIWAFGVILFEMLTGQRPFAGESLMQVIQNITTQAAPDLESLCPDAPIALVDLVYRMLERDPQARISSVRHVGAELEDILEKRESPPQRKRFDTDIPNFIDLPKHNLPTQTTPFIGRDQELEELDKLLQDSNTRLITLMAQGGMGKTRLAMELASRALSQFADGVYIVELASLSDSSNLISFIANATGYSFQADGRSLKQQLLDYFREKHLLLVMDNFEHLLVGVDLMGDILQAAPHLKLIATSRERLNLQEEIVFRIEGLDFPNWETPEDAIEYSAVRLFMQSAKRVRPDFELDVDNLQYVARICRLVEGLPLGIVLAAAWVDMLSLQEITEEIKNNLDFLETQLRNVPQRHRSIRAVLDYSLNLLIERERTIFMKISIFHGGFTRQAAEVVVGADLRTLMSLINKSLIRRSSESGRYDIHELTRQYGEIHLQESGYAAEIQQAYADYFADFMAERYIDLKGRRQLGALDDIEADSEGIRAVWYWACQNNQPIIIDQMLDGLYHYQDIRGQYREGIENLLVAEKMAQEHHHQVLYHRLRVRRARHITLPGLQDFQPEISDIEKALEAARSRQDIPEEAFCLRLLGAIKVFQDKYEDAQYYFEKAYPLYTELDDLYSLAEVIEYQSIIKRALGDVDEALSMTQKALEIKENVNDVSGIGWSLFQYALVKVNQGKYEEGEHLLRRGLKIMKQLKTNHGIIILSNILTGVLFFKGDLTVAHSMAMEILTISKKTINLMGITQASLNLVMFLSILNDDPVTLKQARDNLDNLSKDIISQSVMTGYLELGFAMEALNLGDYDTAQVEFANCIKALLLSYEKSLALIVVFSVKALLDAGAGHLASAVEWLSVAFHYPYQGSAWLEKWDLISQLRSDLQTQLGDSAFDSAWEKGKQRNMETVTQDLIKQYKDDE